MPLKRRCKSCKNFFVFTKKVCPKCGSKQTYAYIVKWVNNRRYVKALHEDITKFEALAIESEWMPVETTKQPLTLSDMKQRYIDKLTTENKPYRKHAALFLDRMIEWWGDVFIEEITPAMIREFQVKIRNMASAAYTNRHLAVAKAAFSYVSDQPNPFKQVKLYREDNVLVRFLTDSEEKALLKAAQGHYLYGIIVVCINTGLRIDNVRNLYTKQVDFEHGWIYVTPKGKSSVLPVPMNETVQTVLKQITPHETGYYFVNPRTGKPWVDFRVAFQRLKATAGIIKEFRIHDLRHSFAVKVGMGGAKLETIQALLGHSTPAVTAKHYRHILNTELMAAVANIATPTDTPPTH